MAAPPRRWRRPERDDRFRASVHYNLGLVAERSGDLKTALESYVVSLKLRDNETVRKAVARVEALESELAELRERLERAEKASRPARSTRIFTAWSSRTTAAAKRKAVRAVFKARRYAESGCSAASSRSRSSVEPGAGRRRVSMIASMAERSGADLMALGKRGNYYSDLVPIGSVAAKIIRLAESDVLLVPTMALACTWPRICSPATPKSGL